MHGIGWSVVSVTLSVCVCMSALWKENGLSCPHQTWYTYALWQSLAMHCPGGQKVKGQGLENRHGHMAAGGCCGHCTTVAGVGLHIIWLLRFLVLIWICGMVAGYGSCLCIDCGEFTTAQGGHGESTGAEDQSDGVNNTWHGEWVSACVVVWSIRNLIVRWVKWCEYLNG